MRFTVPTESRERVDALLESLGSDARGPLVVVHPGASAASRRYPADRFAEVVRRLATTCGCTIVVTGTSEEHGLATIVAGGGPAVANLAGRLDLGELGALIARADVLVSNNTGPVHVASAVGTPVVDLYALTNPQHTPWQVPHRVLYRDVACRYCYKSVCPEGHHDCLRRVAPERVAAAACELLELERAAPAPQLLPL